MSQKIGSDAPALPWDESQLENIRGMREAVARGVAEGRLDDEVAPLMGEFLWRLDELVGSEDDGHLSPPGFSGDEPDARQTFLALRAAIGEIECMVQERPEEASRLEPMLDVLRRYTTLKDEVIHRVDGGRNA